MSQSQRANISFSEKVHDFGKINEKDGKVEKQFFFVNIGAQPLIIGKVRASCGCTTPSWTEAPVLPGEKGFIKAVFNPHGRHGQFSKTITVSSNAEESPIYLTIKGEIINQATTLADKYPHKVGDIRIKDIRITLGKVSSNSLKSKEIEVINVGKKAVEISFSELPGYIQVEALPSKLAPKEKGLLKLEYDGSKVHDWGFVSSYFKLLLNGLEVSNNRLVVTASIEEDFSKLSAKALKKAPHIEFENTTYNFKEVKKGEKVVHDFIFKNTGKSDLIIRKTKVNCGCTASVPDASVISPGAQGKISVTFDSSGRKGPQNKAINVITNDPENSNLVLWIKGEVN